MRSSLLPPEPSRTGLDQCTRSPPRPHPGSDHKKIGRRMPASAKQGKTQDGRDVQSNAPAVRVEHHRGERGGKGTRWKKWEQARRAPLPFISAHPTASHTHFSLPSAPRPLPPHHPPPHSAPQKRNDSRPANSSMQSGECRVRGRDGDERVQNAESRSAECGVRSQVVRKGQRAERRARGREGKVGPGPGPGPQMWRVACGVWTWNRRAGTGNDWTGGRNR
ncbi:hypothetical protein B0H11DRAFT_1031419 [Mycena galericulata]|nr:hypothetical protein B0H11DRAFT_1031419 [Mycena galericulata]